MNKLSIAILSAACFLGPVALEAAPKVSVKVTAPTGTAGAEKAVTGKGMPWLPCTSSAVALGGVTTASFIDKLQFDLDVTNADDDKEGNKLMDYDLYVIFVNYSGGATKYYALIPNPVLFNGPMLSPIADNAAWALLKPSAYRFMSKENFGTIASVKSQLFGPVFLDSANLPQGMWNILAIMTRPENTPITPAPAIPTTLDPILVKDYIDPNTASDKILDPRNWAAWAMQPFVLGTPFATNTGTTGDGTCK